MYTLFLALIAVAVPAWCGLPFPPLRQFLNEWLCVLGWALLILHLALPGARAQFSATRAWRASLPIWCMRALWALWVASAVADLAWGRSIVFHAGMHIAFLGMAALVFEAGVAHANDAGLHKTLWWAFLIAGLGQVVVGIIQMFLPDLMDGLWVAAPAELGRAAGNVRQPNHLATLVLWSQFAVLGLMQVRAIRWPWAAVCMSLFTALLVWTGSRTGFVGLAILLIAGGLQPGLTRSMRITVVAQPLWAVGVYALMMGWAAEHGGLYYGYTRAVQVGADVTSGRQALWSACLALAASQPWEGLGVGRFKFAWVFTTLPHRPAGIFGHSHNLLLQWVLELGWPRACAMTALLGAAVYAATKRWWLERSNAKMAGQLSSGPWLGMVLVVLLHAQLEFPLSYAYFLLPAAWALGSVLGGAAQAGPQTSSQTRFLSGGLQACSVLALVGCCFVLWDYGRLTKSELSAVTQRDWRVGTVYGGLGDEGRVVAQETSSPTQTEALALNALKTRGNPLVLARLSEAFCELGRTAQAQQTREMLLALRMSMKTQPPSCVADMPTTSPIDFRFYWHLQAGPVKR